MPRRDNRCNWRDNGKNRCPLAKADDMNCCLSHRCKATRRCKERARDGTSICRDHQQRLNARVCRTLVPRGSIAQWAEPPRRTGEIQGAVSFEEMARRWNRARRTKAKERDRLNAPGALRKPANSATLCAWHDDSGTRCKRRAGPQRNHCDKHRCQGDNGCALRAENSGTLCRRHRRMQGRLGLPQPKGVPWDQDVELLTEPYEPED